MNRSRRVGQTLLLWLVCLLGWALPAQQAHAAVSCTATMDDFDFGSVDLVNNLGTSTSGTLTYTCTNDRPETAVRVNACFAVDGGQNSQSQLNPSRMLDSGNPSNVLNFNLFLPDGATPWGSSLYGTQPYNPPVFTIPRAPNAVTPSSVTVSVTMSARLVNGQSAVPPNSGVNTYRDSFSAGSTSIGFAYTNAGNPAPASCGPNQPIRFPFTVSAKVIRSCDVTAGTASNIQLGDPGGVNFTDTNLMGNSAIRVTCPSGTPYYVGLSPSNNSTTGVGKMAAMNLAPVTGNTDSVDYQLRSSPGMAGTPWGNTATSTSVGNGVARTGTGASQSITVYATTPSANFTPDSYADTVTVTVNY